LDVHLFAFCLFVFCLPGVSAIGETVGDRGIIAREKYIFLKLFLANSGLVLLDQIEFHYFPGKLFVDYFCARCSFLRTV